MACYIQYSENGDINATIKAQENLPPPAYVRQITVQGDCPAIPGWRVNLETLTLEKVPDPPPEEQ